jgi:hypothetical protein
MFEQLNSVDWANLSHSHGTAEGVPRRLHALLGPTEGERSAALNYFWEYLLHQGSRYEASPHVVPFLFEVLDHPDCRIQRELIDLLLALAVGYGESFLPHGYDLAEEERRYRAKQWRGLFSYDDARSAYYEVHQRAQVFTRFLRPQFSADIRLSAAFCVAHFAQPLSAFSDEVAGHIRVETDPAQLQSLILCVGMLGRYARVKPPQDLLLPYLRTSHSQTLQVIAAIALATIYGAETPEAAVQTLLTALTDAWQLTSPREQFQWWNEGDLLGYAGRALLLLGRQHRETVARALCSALEKTKVSTFAIPYALLDLLFPEPAPEGGRIASEFDVVQRQSMRVLLRTNHWRTWMISERFLPRGLAGERYQSALRQFQHDILGEDPGSTAARFANSGNVSSWDLKKHWPPQVLDGLMGNGEPESAP